MKCYEIGGKKTVTATLAECCINHGYQVTM